MTAKSGTCLWLCIILAINSCALSFLQLRNLHGSINKIEVSIHRNQCRSSRILLMANDGNKKRKRRKKVGVESESIIEKVSTIDATMDTSYNPALAELFDSDWSGMAVPKGMVRTNEKLPSLEEIPKLKDLKPKVPLETRKEREMRLREETKYNEGNTIRWVKTITWFAIVSLVGWEVYIHSPFFKPPGQV